MLDNVYSCTAVRALQSKRLILFCTKKKVLFCTTVHVCRSFGATCPSLKSHRWFNNELNKSEQYNYNCTLLSVYICRYLATVPVAS